MNALPPVEIAQQLSSTRALLERNLAKSLRALHLFGSAVDGGLKPYSDIDLLVTVSAPLAVSVRHSLTRELLSVSAWPGASQTYRALEVTIVVLKEVVPWRYPPVRELQFGEWLREEIQAGIVQPPALDHDLALLLMTARQKSVCLLGKPASELFAPVPKEDVAKALLATTAQWREEPDWHGDERNVVLALARIWFSLTTGETASKHAAATWALERLPHEHCAVLATARAAYLGSMRDDLADHREQVAAYVRYMKTAVETLHPGRSA